MRGNKVALYGYMVFISVTSAYAQVTPETSREAAQQADRLIQEDQLRRQREEQEREALRQNQTPLPQDAFKPKIPEPIADATCSKITTITLAGDSLIPAKQKAQLIAPYQNRCLTLDNINQLLAAITNYYFDRGAVTSRAYVPRQNLNDGELEIIIIEGKLNELESETLSNSQLKQSFPVHLEQTLNLRDLEQGLDQINRLQSKQATLKLIPGDKPGQTRVNISSQKVASRWRLINSIDNSGQESTGEEQVSLNASIDNPFGLVDFFSINLQSDTGTETNAGTESLSLHYDLPLGYWNFDIDLSAFDYESEVEGNIDPFQTSGESRNQSVRVSRLWKRSQQSKVGNRLTIKRKKNENFVEDTLLETSSRTLASANLETYYQRTIPKGSWGISFFYDKGLDNFGAEDDSGKAADEPLAQFDKIRLNANYSKAFRLSSYPLNYRANFYSQYSEDILYGAEQISIGSQYSVRGYKQQGVSGNKGGYIRQELSGYFPPIKWLGRWQWAFGLDWGKVRDLNPEREKYTDLTGYGLRLRNLGKALNISIEVAKATDAPDTIDTDSEDIYISINYQYPR